MQNYKCVNFFINIFVLSLVLLSYYIKRQIGLILCTFLLIFIFVYFVTYSLFILISYKKQYSTLIIQVLAVLLFLLIFKFNLSDKFALLIEIPKIEKKIETIKQTHILEDDIEISDEYIIFAWEPGFLDNQQVIVYDEKDNLKNVEDGKKNISIGRLYVIKKARDYFYLCILYR